MWLLSPLSQDWGPREAPRLPRANPRARVQGVCGAADWAPLGLAPPPRLPLLDPAQASPPSPLPPVPPPPHHLLGSKAPCGPRSPPAVACRGDGRGLSVDPRPPTSQLCGGSEPRFPRLQGDRDTGSGPVARITCSPVCRAPGLAPGTWRGGSSCFRPLLWALAAGTTVGSSSPSAAERQTEI